MDINQIISECEKESENLFAEIEHTALYNQEKVLNAFINNKVALRHFAPTTGYGYDDVGRDTLSDIFSEIFNSEAAIVSPLIASGTHALSIALFGILRPNDLFVSISGTPYDTLEKVIAGKNIGSLKDFNISFSKVDLTIDGNFDKKKIEEALADKPKLVTIQRSRGYSWRNSFSCIELSDIVSYVKNILPDVCIMVDNCYGEFVDKFEPTDVGADIIVGSLIKNPGGGLAPTGGYIAGKKKYISQIEGRFTAPGTGAEIGSYLGGYKDFYQGLFLAPHVTAQALKGSVLFGSVFEKLGYETLPKPRDRCNDIIRSIKFDSENELVQFCQTIQKCSPVDSFAVPYPWDMPGYAHKVIMAAGAFIQGSSIELSADSPIREPYIAYLQGGLTYEHVKIAVRRCAEEIVELKNRG